MINLGVGLLIAALPWLVGGVFSAGDLPPLLAYLFFPGRPLLFLLGAMVVLWTVGGSRVQAGALSGKLKPVIDHRAFATAALALLAVVAVARVPQQEKEAEAFGGDEPKYLRIAFSLLRDTDADISGGRTETPALAVRMQQVRNLILTGRDATLGLFRTVEVPNDHTWNAGNWTVRGLEGGLYHLQPPGLPALVALALGIGEMALPERDPGIYVFVLLVLIWIAAARELWLLGLQLTADRLTTAVLVGVVFASAPVFVGGYQLFPESLALFLFPWLFRRLGSTGLKLGAGAALLSGFVTGYLLWIHPKLTIVAALFVFIAWLRPETSMRVRILFTTAFALTAFTSLLYCFQISGLFRPEGLYIRQAEEYVGSPNPLSLRFAAGLVKALVGGRDGLLIFAPILALGALALNGLKRPSRPNLELLGLFVVVLLTSAVHDGASLGSPARLMAPVAFIPALFLARALRDQPPRFVKAMALLLFLFGCQITATVNADWRRNVNPYRTMFTHPSTNFEPSLPGNSFSEEAYLVDLVKGGFMLITLAASAELIRRRSRRHEGRLEPAYFGGGVLAIVAFLAFGLHWLTP